MAMTTAGLVLALTGCGGDDGGDGNAATFCERFATYEADRDELAERNAGTEGGLDVDELKAEYAEVQEQLDGLVESAPEEVASDVEAVVDGLREVDAEVAEAETVEDIAAASEQLDADEAVQAAGDRVQDWIDANCEVDGDG